MEEETLLFTMYWQMMQKIHYDTQIILFRLRQKRKKRLLLALQYLMNTPFPILQPHRSIWMKSRSSEWWKNALKNYTDDEWKDNFRVSRKTYKFICVILQKHLESPGNKLNSVTPVSVEKKVAMALHFFGSCWYYGPLARKFGIHPSTVWKCLHSFVNVVNKVLITEWLSMPNETESINISNNFYNLSSIPNIIGCIDTSHIPITSPSDGNIFVNNRGWTSMVIQGVVDHNYRFRSIHISNSGSATNESILKDSSFFKDQHYSISKVKKSIQGTEVPYIITGDSSYPLLDWLIPPYSGEDLSIDQLSFNENLKKTLSISDMAFARLKSRWKCLLKRLEVHYSFVPKIVTACCILHNISEFKMDNLEDRWMQNFVNSEDIFPRPPTTKSQYISENGKVVRDKLCSMV